MNTDLDTVQSFAVGRTSLGGATVLSPSGSLTYETCAELRSAFEEAAETPHAGVVVDCRQVKAMDSEALELLVEWHEKLSDGGADLKLSNLNDVCSDILVVTRLIHVLGVCADIKDAVQAGRGS